MTTYCNLWQLLVALGNFWELMATFGNLWQPMATYVTLLAMLLILVVRGDEFHVIPQVH